MIKYIVIEMWRNWCFHVLQLKVEVPTIIIKGYLAICFFNVGTGLWIFNFVYWSIFCIFFLNFVYFVH